jgi:hypothetical protein
MWDDEIDGAIDAVAREMTDGMPRGELRTRVIDRIDARSNRARWLQPGVAVLTAIATAAVVMIAVAGYRATARKPVPAGPGVTATAGPTGPALHTDVRRPGPAGPGDTVASTNAARPKGPALHATPRRAVIPPSAVDTLAPAPLTMDSLAIGGLSAAPIDVIPLDTIPPIAVAPLGDEGDRR